MAYIFPINPVDGQLYPNPAIAGSLQYVWNAGQNAWLIYSPLGVQSVSGLLPIVVTNNSSNPVVSILPATISAPGSMSAADKTKIDGLPAIVGTVRSVGCSTGLTTNLPGNSPITTSGDISLLPPSGAAIGGVKAGANITIAPDGTISGFAGTVTSINCVDGIIAAPNPITSTGTITLRPASNILIGGVIVGRGLSVDSAGLISLATDIYSNGVVAWGCFSNNRTAPVPTFGLKEGFNISSISYVGGPRPVARIAYVGALPDTNYAVTTAADTFWETGTPDTVQLSTVLNYTAKTITSIDLKSQSIYTLNNTGPSNTIVWNTWNSNGPGGSGCFQEFDFQALDTRVFS
jgi:hypothetical protein